jgi:hypothetical protein
MNRKKRVWLWIVSACIAAVLMAAGVAWRALSIPVTVYNAASATLENVRISLAGKEIWTGTLGPDEKHSARALPEGEGTVAISFEAEGRTFHQEFGYVTAGFGGDYTIYVLPSFEMRAVPPP